MQQWWSWHACARASKWIQDHGDVTHKPSWENLTFNILVFYININTQTNKARMYVLIQMGLITFEDTWCIWLVCK